MRRHKRITNNPLGVKYDWPISIGSRLWCDMRAVEIFTKCKASRQTFLGEIFPVAGKAVNIRLEKYSHPFFADG